MRPKQPPPLPDLLASRQQLAPKVEALVVVHSDSLASYAFEGGDANVLATRIADAIRKHKTGPTLVVHQDWGTETTERLLRAKPTEVLVFDEADEEHANYNWTDFTEELATWLLDHNVTHVVLAGAWCTRHGKWGCVNETQKRLEPLGFKVRVEPTLTAYAEDTHAGGDEPQMMHGHGWEDHGDDEPGSDPVLEGEVGGRRPRLPLKVLPFRLVDHGNSIGMAMNAGTYAAAKLPPESVKAMRNMLDPALDDFLRDKPNTAAITWVGVETQWRHQGIGQKLVAALEAELIKRGITTVVLEAVAAPTEYQAKLETWYRTQGYANVPNSVKACGVQFMFKHLAPGTTAGPPQQELRVIERKDELLVGMPGQGEHALVVSHYSPGRAMFKWLRDLDLNDAGSLLLPHPKISAYVTSIEVPADVQRQGLGSRLLGRVEQELRNKKVGRILLHAMAFGSRSQIDLLRWYQERGFNIQGEREIKGCKFCLMSKDLGVNGFDATKRRLKRDGHAWEDWIGQTFTRDAVMTFLEATDAQDNSGELDLNGLKEATIAADKWKLELVRFADVLGWNWRANKEPVNRTPIVTWGAEHGWAVTDGMHRIGAARARGEAGILAFVPMTRAKP